MKSKRSCLHYEAGFIKSILIYAAAVFPIIIFAGRLQRLGEWLISLGVFGVFAISLIDSMIIPLPSGPDLTVITLSALKPGWMPIYAVAASIGSLIGCVILYSIAHKAGEKALQKVNPKRREWIENMLGRYDMLALAVSAILPPPFPFKIFVLSSGVFKFKMTRFIGAVLTGRLIRFLLEGWLAVRFGKDAWEIILKNGKFVLLIVAIALVVFILFKLLNPVKKPALNVPSDPAEHTNENT